MSHPQGEPADRQAVFERLLHRNFIRMALGLKALNVHGLYWRKAGRWSGKHHTKPHSATDERISKMLQPRPSPQSELEPTDAERQQIMRDAKARNAEGIVARFAERDLALMIELGLTRYRANKYQELLGPYFEICLQKIQKPAGTGPSPADYREAVATAEAQLRDVTGIVSPKSMMVPEVAGLVRHRP